MNVDAILSAFTGRQVDYLLIGGMNFLLRHLPELTFDVDLWVADEPENLRRVNEALCELGAEWGPTDKEWTAIPPDWKWMQRQTVFCLTTKHGALDIFRDVRGLEGRYQECKRRGISSQTSNGVAFTALADADMLACQEALPPAERKERRMQALREALRRGSK